MIARRDAGPAARDRRVERLLGATGLFDRVEGFRGALRAAGLEARVTVEAPECVRLTHVPDKGDGGPEAHGREPGETLRARAALELNAALDGNTRLALAADGLRLVADTVLGDGTHLEPVLRGALESYARARGTTRARGETVPALDEDRVEAGLRETGWTEDDVVRRADGWELRPRLHGVVRAVRLAVHGRDVRLWRVVLEAHPDGAGASGRAADDLALRLNDTLRRARLALVDGALIAETCLKESELRGPRLVDAARAVLSAARLAEPSLELLLANPGVAVGYAELFLTPTR